MGGDGGSFSHRTEMVRTKGFKFLRNLGGMGYTPNTQIRAGDERFGKNESRDLRTSACAFSQEKLQPPLLACRIGRLYNKEAVIKALLEKALPAHMKHVKSLKDMKEVQVDINAETGFPVCPITKADLSSGVRACIIWPCGFIVSNRAIEAMTQKDGDGSKQDSSSSSSNNNSSSNVESGRPKIRGSFVCPMCSKEHDASEDLIPLSPDEEETSALLEKALQQQQAKQAAKKKNKAAAAAAGSNSGASTSPEAAPKEGEKPQSPNPENEKETESAHSINKRRNEAPLPLPTSKRLKDWVLEAEVAALPPPTSSTKQRKVAA
ncbi:hypothetical protein, conserved [Eimeria acervulina]|uniref:Replication termination factor 2 n=1 Tax=Eimeria acervulina TaxID=5801 RepID=U6GX70_EIMAC|nr:hypothetical protein, conserved [Eimeria acervulina]CDI83858.1 hypothetical protein, conserved [Eimeria acervulina]